MPVLSQLIAHIFKLSQEAKLSIKLTSIKSLRTYQSDSIILLMQIGTKT